MGTETERKFLVGRDWKPPVAGTRIVQGYLSAEKERTVRVRLYGDEAFLTIKGPSTGLSRPEYEYPIPVADAEEILRGLCLRPFIDKVRHLVDYAGKTWEVDVFHGDNEGLVVAELELASDDEAFESPPWLGPEVSEDRRYSNSNLARNPWPTWGRPRT